MTRNPVPEDLKNFVPATFELTLAAMIYAAPFGVPLGILAAIRQNSWADHLSRFLALIGTSVPVFWLGLLMLYLFSHRFGWAAGFRAGWTSAWTPRRRSPVSSWSMPRWRASGTFS